MTTLDPPEHLTEDGARELALRIASYWADRGVYINTRLEECRAPSSFEGRSALFCVRSDLRVAIALRANAA